MVAFRQSAQPHTATSFTSLPLRLSPKSTPVQRPARVTSVAAGLIGSFAVMRRMSLAADPLSHVALPGIGVALALQREPIFAAVAALLVGAFLVWVLEDNVQAATESIIGVVFSAAVAIGSL